jgi:hypothetical protein
VITFKSQKHNRKREREDNKMPEEEQMELNTSKIWDYFGCHPAKSSQAENMTARGQIH